MSVTADTVTDAQLVELLYIAERECRVPRIEYVSINAPSCVADLIAINWALGRFVDWYLDGTGHMHRVGGRHANRAACVRNGRIRCASIINARGSL